MKNIKNLTFMLLITAFMIVMSAAPQTVISAAKSGTKICLDVIIPSLFPFMFFINIIITGGYLNVNGGTKHIPAIVYLLSALGGYPLGARLIEGLYCNNVINKESAEKMQCFCFNAGPGFILLAVGAGVLGNKTSGYVLLCSHIISSFVMFLILKRKITVNTVSNNNRKPSFSYTAVSAGYEASKAVVGICSFVIIFSVIIEFTSKYLSRIKSVNYILLLLEISNAVQSTKNVYIISFLLGFGGICVWMQVFSILKNCKTDKRMFMLSRIIHGALSSFITFIIVRIFNIKTNVSSYIADYSFLNSFNRLFLSVSIIIMLIVLFTAVFNKNKGGNLINDIV